MRDRFGTLRIAGGLSVAVFAWLVARPLVGPVPGLGVALLVGALAAWFLPRPVVVRVVWTLPMFALLLFVTIQLMFHVSGSPFASEKVTTPEVMKQQKALYGIPEKSFVGGCRFFGAYVYRLFADGTMGPCIKVQGRSVTDVLLPALPVSLTLGILAITIATGLGLTLGVVAGLKPNSIRDYLTTGFGILGVCMPSFVIGAILMVVFSLGKPFSWLPVAGWGSYGNLILPALSLALPYAAYIARLARSGTIEVMTQDFVRTARAKGLPEREVVLKHALRGALVPVVSFLGPAAAGIVTGSFVVETLFSIPGMGQWFVRSAQNRDYYVVLGTALLECGIVVVFNLLVDLALPLIDPRLRDRS